MAEQPRTARRGRAATSNRAGNAAPGEARPAAQMSSGGQGGAAVSEPAAAPTAAGSGAAGAGGAASFGEVLQRLRIARGMSQSAVAARAGMDRSYVNRLEAGERGVPALPALEALAAALELPEAEADRLFAVAGLLPRSLRALGAADPTLLLLAQRLTDPRLSYASRAALRAAVEALALHWGNPVSAAPRTPAGPAAPAAGERGLP